MVWVVERESCELISSELDFSSSSLSREARSFCSSVCEDDYNKRARNKITCGMVIKWRTFSFPLADCSCSFSSLSDCSRRASSLLSPSSCSIVASRSRSFASNSTFSVRTWRSWRSREAWAMLEVKALVRCCRFADENCGSVMETQRERAMDCGAVRTAFKFSGERISLHGGSPRRTGSR